MPSQLRQASVCLCSGLPGHLGGRQLQELAWHSHMHTPACERELPMKNLWPVGGGRGWDPATLLDPSDAQFWDACYLHGSSEGPCRWVIVIRRSTELKNTPLRWFISFPCFGFSMPHSCSLASRLIIWMPTLVSGSAFQCKPRLRQIQSKRAAFLTSYTQHVGFLLSVPMRMLLQTSQPLCSLCLSPAYVFLISYICLKCLQAAPHSPK